MRTVIRSAFAAAPIIAIAMIARADIAVLNPVADAFVTSASPNANYGGAGSLAVSAPGSAQGEFQSVLRFDTSSAVSGLNTAYGAGHWSIQSITLQLSAMLPNNMIFNAQAAGQFAVRWMQNDAWTEGSGTPMNATSTGVTYSTLPSFLGPSDEALGAFSFGGGTSATARYALALTNGFSSDVAAGGLVSLQLLASDGAVSYLFNSRSFNTPANRPELIITTTPAPAGGALAAVAGIPLLRRTRRKL